MAKQISIVSMVHGRQSFTDAERSPVRLWHSTIATLLYAGMMSFFALSALSI